MEMNPEPREKSLACRKIEERFPQAALDWHAEHGDETLLLRKDAIFEVARLLKEDPELQFNLLVDITAVDYFGRHPRFEIVYHFLSLPFNQRLRIKLQSDDLHPTIKSLTPLWKTANWLERECFDMYGIRFEGHPNLTRVLLYEEFQGHPLRKDYPKTKRQPLIGPQN
ncbi:MAG: NADH-quinone oxidoreductase subunit C [bacterium]